MGAPSLWTRNPEGLDFSVHPGQVRAWDSKARFTWVFAGTQSGKTSWGPWWLAREIGTTADPAGGTNDYLAVTASYDLFKLKMLPELLTAFEQVTQVGRYWSGDRIIELRDPNTGKFWANRVDKPMWGRIVLRSASAGGGLESLTGRAAWLDECGQEDFTVETWEAVLRRLSLKLGRVLGTTTLYDIGWLKTEVWDRFQRIGTPNERPGDRDHLVINFDSTENPVFPRAEYERARAAMPEWRFNMFYRGLFTRPAGQIYDCFIDADAGEGGHRMRPRPLPDHWHRVAGIDFGVVHTALGLYAVAEDGDGHPTGRLLLRKTYQGGSRNATEHVAALREAEPRLSLVVGGAPSEDQWRTAYLWAGLPVYAPTVTDVEVGIDNVYGATKQGKLLVFDTERGGSTAHNGGYIDQKLQYSRELDAAGNPTTAIKDKAKYHLMDQERYLVSLMFPGRAFLPWESRRHLAWLDQGGALVGARPQTGGDAERRLPEWWNRVAGLRYSDGQPAGFLLLAIDEEGTAVAEAEILQSALVPAQFAERVRSLLRARGVDPSRVPIACNAEMFVARQMGTVSAEAEVEHFRRAGLSCVEAAADGRSEWSALKGRLARTGAGGLRVLRDACPLTALTLPRIVADTSKPDEPDARGPIALGQALCYGLMMRPAASRAPAAVASEIPEGLPAHMRRELEAALRKQQQGRR